MWTRSAKYQTSKSVKGEYYLEASIWMDSDLEDSSTGLILGVQYTVFLLNNTNFKFKVKSNS